MKRWAFTLLVLAPLVLLAASSFAPNRRLWFHPVASGGSSSLPQPSAYWNMDAASGAETDQTGNGNNLTDNNSVTSGTGIIGGSRQFTSNNLEYLSIADNSTVSTDNKSWSLSVWIKCYGTNIGSGIASKWAGSTPNREWKVSRDGSGSASGRYAFIVSSNGTSQTSFNAGSFWRPPTNTWHHLVLQFNLTNLQVQVYQNGTNFTSQSMAGAYNNGGAASMFLGYDANTYFNGELDEVAWFSGFCLASNQVSEIYNAGAGKAYPW